MIEIKKHYNEKLIIVYILCISSIFAEVDHAGDRKVGVADAPFLL